MRKLNQHSTEGKRAPEARTQTEIDAENPIVVGNASLPFNDEAPEAAAIKFAATYEETLAIIAIVTRAAELGLPWIDSQTAMDLDACHSNGCPMDFDALLRAPEMDFTHDLAGIAKYLNRETGRLENCFWPRYALSDARKAAGGAQP